MLCNIVLVSWYGGPDDVISVLVWGWYGGPDDVLIPCTVVHVLPERTLIGHSLLRETNRLAF